MTRSRRSTPLPPPPTRPALTQPRLEVARQLEERIKLGKNIQNGFTRPQNQNLLFPPSPSGYMRDIKKWREYNIEMLKTLFTADAIADQYPSRMFVISDDNIERNCRLFELFQKNVVDEIAALESILGRPDLYAEPPAFVVEARETMPIEYREQKVFVVHGHDEGAREGVARFLEKLGLKAIILREQPNQGRTTIEKFVDYARDVGFAVVLLTPDDLGGATATEVQLSRARQNVIFELGYFVASLGRGRACLLRKGEVEIPSDLYGVVYTDIDGADGWIIELGVLAVFP